MNNKSKILIRITSLVLMISFIFVLSACFNKAVVNLTFDSQGGSVVSSQSLTKGRMAVEPDEPKKESYIFGGWYQSLEFETKFSFETKIEENTTLYAKWLDIIIVTFDSQGGTAVNPVSFGQGTIPASPNAPTKEGFTFGGWYKENNFRTLYDFKTPLVEPTVLYAKWQSVLSNKDKIQADLAAINLPSIVNADLDFPSKGENGSSLTWTTNKPHIISNKGKVLFGGINTNEVVEVVVKSAASSLSETKTFSLTVSGKKEVLITNSKTVNFNSVSSEYIVEDGQIDLFFEEHNLLPYVDISDFLFLLDGAIESVADEPVNIEADDGNFYDVVKYMTVELIEPNVIKVRSIAEYSVDGVLSETDSYEALLDFDLNTFYTNSFDFLDSLGASTSTDFGEGLTFGDSIYTEGVPLNIPLGDYRFDLVTHDVGNSTKYLMPLQVANLLFVGQVYYDVYYNGEALYGVDSYQFLDGERIVQSQVKKSGSNNLEASIEEKTASFDFITLAFDYFYGLKDVNGVETYYEVFGQYINDFIFGTDDKHYQSIFNLTYGMDDLHTYHTESGFYQQPSKSFQLALSDLGSRSRAYYENSWAIGDELTKKFGSETLPELRITPDGLTAIISIEGFDVDTPVNFKANLDIVASLYPSVINVIVDLSTNGGGNVGAVWRTLGYMTDDVIYYHSQNPTTKATVSYTIYDEYPKFDYNWYVLVSPITFSAANMMASTVQEQGIATVIGITSSGGASSISGLVLPTGDVLFYSSTSVISRKLPDGSFESVEYGVTPDIIFSEYNDLYDLNYIQTEVNRVN